MAQPEANPGLSACSRTLQITEIVRMICDEADTGWLGPKQTLVTLARTSRIFSDPAFDNIWREQTSLAPLVKCMPDTLWEEKGVGSKRVIHLRRPIMSTDIPRLLFYSVRIKELTLESQSYYGTVHTDFLKALDMCLVPYVLMPKLSQLTWSPEMEEAPESSFVHHLLGRQSRKIDLDLFNSPSALSLFPYMKSSCPLVSDFRLIATVDPVTIPMMSDVVCGWEQLQILTIGNLDKRGFIHVARLPALKQLHLGPVKNTGLLPLHLPEFLPRQSFPALADLRLICDAPRFCVGIIKVISSRRLKSITIRPLTAWTASAWEEIHTTFHDCLDETQLEDIDVEQMGERNPLVNASPYILTSSTLRPLLKFNLCSLRFQLDPGVEIDDDFLEEMAIAWPQLNTLMIGTDILTTRIPRATLKCLVPFARHCPDLYSLGIRMDVTDIPEFSQVAGNRVGLSLDALHVGTSPLTYTQTTEVAAFLSNIFFELVYIFVSSDTEPLPHPLKTYEKNWGRVQAMVPVFCSVRSQEEKFWTEELGGGEDASDEDGDDAESSTMDETEANS
ncbi:hypothetical protein DFH09DRAFT_330703 [Mycena vulgaris]|nr:hypothetical protein DFH09DRAFT_330703 [Mycena vulgaris]